MTSTNTNQVGTSVVVFDPTFSDPERLALAGFLAGYRGLTRDAYSLDLRQFVSWCDQHQLKLFSLRRSDIECFAASLEARGRARAGPLATARRQWQARPWNRPDSTKDQHQQSGRPIAGRLRDQQGCVDQGARYPHAAAHYRRRHRPEQPAPLTRHGWQR